MATIGSVLRGQVFTATNIIRAINSVWGNIGANRDDRDWTAIMASADPLAASEIALVEMYQNAAYLIRNANSLRILGYSQNQIVYTYHQLADRLGFIYSADWAIGTAFADTAVLSFSSLRSRAIRDWRDNQNNDQNNNDIPTLTITNDAAGFLIQSNLDGQLIFDDGTVIANLTAAVDIRFPEIGALRTGQIVALSAGNVRSTASTQTVTLGTAGNDVYDGSAINTAQFISTGDGADIITGGAGADTIYAGDGDDIIIGSQEDIRLDGGNGNDTLQIFNNFTINDPFQIRNIETIQLMADGLTLDLRGSFSEATLRGFATGGSTIIGSDGVDVFIGGDGDDVFIGGAGNANKTFTGGGGNDRYTGGFGNDTFNIDAGTDTITNLSASDVFVISPGATLNATVSQSYTATAASRNLGGGAANAVFDVINNANIANFSLVTVANAETDGITINSNNFIGATSTITGTAGNDIINGITGFFRGETLNGGAGDDVIIGGDGNDTITGGAGADRLTGGAGVNTFVFNAVFNVSSDSDRFFDFDLITDLKATDFLVLNLSDMDDFDINFIAMFGDTIDIFTASPFSDTFINLDPNNGLDTDNIRAMTILNVTLSDEGGTFFGGINGDTVTGGNGSDIINGNEGNDFLFGGAGDDFLFGDAGNDILTGGAGDDALTGGADNDTFVFQTTAALNGFDTVFDFMTGTNVIDFAFGDGGRASLAELRGDGTRVQFGNATGALAIDANAGLVVNTTVASGLLAADVVTDFGNNTGTLEADIFYYIASDDNDAVIYKIHMDADNNAVDLFEVTTLAILTGVTATNLATLTAANFADFIAI